MFICALPACVCTLCIPGICRGQSLSPGTVLQTVVSCHIVHIMLGIKSKSSVRAAAILNC